jgi:hypothetical protein
MPIFRAIRTSGEGDAEQEIYIEAPNKQEARASLWDLGWSAIKELEHFPGQREMVPEGTEFIEFQAPVSIRPEGLDSDLLRMPISTIAIGVFFGLAAFEIVKWLVALAIAYGASRGINSY